MAQAQAAAHGDNRLLAALPRDAFAEMSRDLRQISLVQGNSLFEPGAPLDNIYFPHSGMISLMVVTSDGRAVEISTIGREGAVGLHGALGARFSFTRAITQIGGVFSTIAANRFAQFVREYAPVRDLISRYTEILWAESQQIAACNAAHDAPARLCRWLLQTADRTGSDLLPLTQELIAEMLVVRRTTVTFCWRKRCSGPARSNIPAAISRSSTARNSSSVRANVIQSSSSTTSRSKQG